MNTTMYVVGRWFLRGFPIPERLNVGSQLGLVPIPERLNMGSQLGLVRSAMTS
jgi:hypothetical protein